VLCPPTLFAEPHCGKCLLSTVLLSQPVSFIEVPLTAFLHSLFPTALLRFGDLHYPACPSYYLPFRIRHPERPSRTGSSVADDHPYCLPTGPATPPISYFAPPVLQSQTPFLSPCVFIDSDSRFATLSPRFLYYSSELSFLEFFRDHSELFVFFFFRISRYRTGLSPRGVIT